MKKHTLFLSLMIVLCSAFSVRAEHFRNVALVISDTPSVVEQNIINLLRERILEKTTVPISVHKQSDFSFPTHLPQKDKLVILLGTGNNNGALNQYLAQQRIPTPTETNPGPEGFLLKTLQTNLLAMSAVDNRGLLYAVGEYLRQCDFKEKGFEINPLQIRTAPAFEVRGTQYGQSHVAISKAKVRPWTRADKERAILDLALAGANTFLVEKSENNEKEDFDFLKSFDLLTCGVFIPNMAPTPEFPLAWRASESIGRPNFICPSVPEAQEAVLEACEKRFKDSPSFDFIQLKGGDGGGCECDRCHPFGHVFIHLSEKIAKIIHRYHPQTRLYFTNQKFDNESDQAILDYLNEKPREWLWAWGYGPGSDATSWQPGHRQNHRMDLFRYPGFGPYGLYPKALLHHLPARHPILYFNEVTHWRYAQHGYIQMYPRADRDGNLPPHWSHEIYERRPDQALTMVYDRLTFYAWPHYYHRVFNDLMRYGVGDITHSSGNHDHFNQWMWQRLLWNPRLQVQEVVEEYAKAWFGTEAAPLMTAAILQLESNLEELKDQPLHQKKGIEIYYDLVKRAGDKIPNNLMKNNWLWRMYMQKGALDLYIKHDLTQQIQTQNEIENSLRKNARNPEWKLLEKQIDNILQQETPAMKSLREEATRLGEESNQIFGTRSEGIFNLRHDYIGLGWLRRQLQRAQQVTSQAQREEILAMITDYEGKSVDAYYDNLGTANHAPHVVNGYPYDHGQPYVPTMLSENNRPSQRSMHFTQNEDEGVTLLYTNLPSGQNYRIRLTLVRPVFQERYAELMKQKSQSLYANGKLVAKDLELPEFMSDHFTFDIPATWIQNGQLEIKFIKDPSVLSGDRVTTEQWRNTGGWGTLLSEAWLIPVK